MVKRRIITLIMASLSLLCLRSARSAPAGIYYSANERFGVNRVTAEISEYDMAGLRAGWYVDWHVTAAPAHPGGVEYVQVARLCHGKDKAGPDLIAQAVAANPGALWLIGNEPDSPWQDNCLPDEYAQGYHDAYTLIKSLDPTAVVAAGGIIQATPLRMKYMDQILAAYQARYGAPIPVDAWHIHGFVFREERYSWGAEIPPGLPDSRGRLYNLRDVDNMDYFRDHIVRFRQWMAQHGWRDKPLHVDEYGIVMPADYTDEDGRPFDAARARAFMLSTFDYMLYTTDAEIGYPADDNRLAQSWAWYSLQDDIYDEQGQLLDNMYNGDLFDGHYFSTTLTPLGQAYADYLAPLVTPYVDLWPQRLGVEAERAVWGSTSVVTLTAEIANRGNVTSTAASQAHFSGSRGQVGPAANFSIVPPRYRGVAPATTTWAATLSGTAIITVSVDPGGTTLDVNPGNNTRAFAVAFTCDAAPQSLTFRPAAPLLAGGSVQVTAYILIANTGNTGAPDVTTHLWSNGQLKGQTPTISLLPGGGKVYQAVAWSETSPGLKTIAVRVSSPATPDRWLAAHLLVASHRLWLPVARK